MRLKRICKSITCIVMSAGFVFTGIPHTASYDEKKIGDKSCKCFGG